MNFDIDGMIINSKQWYNRFGVILRMCSNSEQRFLFGFKFAVGIQQELQFAVSYSVGILRFL